MSWRVVLAVASSSFVAATFGCGAPETSAGGGAPGSESSPVAATTCDLLQASMTFDAPRADGRHVHGACDACLQESCCEVTMQCFGSDGRGECAPLGACLSTCPLDHPEDTDPIGFFECRNKCYAEAPSAQKAYDAYVGCRKAACQIACGDPA